jgi:two-component system, cell cycle sensor histidine kinase and response regulator CckA
MPTDRDKPKTPRVSDETSFRLLFVLNPLPIYVFDNASLAILAVNDAAVAKYGWTREEFLEMTIEDIRPPEEIPALRAYRRRVYSESSSGLNQAMAWRHWTKTGEIIDMETTWMEVPWEGVVGVMVTGIDRSELKRAEERAREQASLLDLAADAIIVRGLDDLIVYWNRGAERLYGWNAAEAIGKKATEVMQTDPGKAAAAEKELLQNGHWSGQIDQKTKSGSNIVTNSRWTFVTDELKQPKSVLVINTDLTETKKLESQFLRAQRLESIGTLASGIAHDLNNILAPILMSVGFLRKTNTDPEADSFLNIIESSAERGAGIVKQVLTFARGVDGDRARLEPDRIVDELLAIMVQTFPKNLDIQSDVPPKLWSIAGDATQLHQVLLNLCVNARDATPAGGRITVGAKNIDVDAQLVAMNPGAQLGRHVAFSVADTGAGMTTATLEKIFDPFFTTKEVGKGTGLGLATVLGIVKSHGGFLTVKSYLGVGTTFTVFIPAAKEPEAAPKAAATGPIESGAGRRVLLVDDEPAIREAVSCTLQASGYEVFTAEDGTDALALYHQRRDDIDVVLTDISMGQMDGVTLSRALKRLNPKVRIIVSSGHFHKDNVTILESLGITTFLDKPYTAEKLLRSLQAELARPNS